MWSRTRASAGAQYWSSRGFLRLGPLAVFGHQVVQRLDYEHLIPPLWLPHSVAPLSAAKRKLRLRRPRASLNAQVGTNPSLSHRPVDRPSSALGTHAADAGQKSPNCGGSRRSAPRPASARVLFKLQTLVRIVADLASDWRQLDERIENVTDEIEALAKSDDSCRRVLTVPASARSFRVRRTSSPSRESLLN